MGRRRSKLGNLLIEALVVIFVQLVTEIFKEIRNFFSSIPNRVESNNQKPSKKNDDAYRNKIQTQVSSGSASTYSNIMHFNRERIQETCSACGSVIKSNSPYCPKCLIIVKPELIDKTIIVDRKVLTKNINNKLLRTIVVKNDSKIQNKIPKTEDLEIICRSCGARTKPNSSYCPECKTIVPLEDLKLLNSRGYQKPFEAHEDQRIKEDAKEIFNKNLQRTTSLKNDIEIQQMMPKAECIQPLSELFEDISDDNQEFYETPVTIVSKNNRTELKNTIPFFESPKSQIIEENKTEKAIPSLNWAGFGESIQIGDFTIKDPITYWSEGELGSPEASCIDITLPIWIFDVKNPVYSVYDDIQDIPDWPIYKDLTSRQRGNYLLWLSGGKNVDLHEIGYAFIYFFGLERRALLDKKDIFLVLDECCKLVARYTFSNTFTARLQDFIAFLFGTNLDEIDENSEVHRYFSSFNGLNERLVMVILSWYDKNDKPIPCELAYAIAQTSRITTKDDVFQKAPELFKKLFEKKFFSQFPAGVRITHVKELFRWDYHPSNPSILDFLGYDKHSSSSEVVLWPIKYLISDDEKKSFSLVLHPPAYQSKEYETLLAVWAECVEKFIPLSHQIVKTGGEITREVYPSLPPALKSEIVHPDFEAWNHLIQSKTPMDETVFVQVSELASILGIEKRRLFSTSAQSETISLTASEIGYLLIPDYKMSGIPYKWKDYVALIVIPDKSVHSGATTEVFGINPALKPTSENIYLSKNFQKVSLIFEMAYAIAASDGKVTEQEEAFLYKYIIGQYELTPFDVKCIRALQNILLIQSLSLTEIGKRLVQHLDTEQKKVTVATFFGDIVLIDKKFEKREEKTLKKVFKSLEIDSSVAAGIIKNLLIDQSDEPAAIKKGKTRKDRVSPHSPKQLRIDIDENKLKKTIEDTLAVRKILDPIFERESEESEVIKSPTSKVSNNSDMRDLNLNELSLPFPQECIASLDVKYLPILNEIMISDKLSKIEFANMVKKHHLMPQATFEEINSWADEELGDFLLVEYEDHITINFKT